MKDFYNKVDEIITKLGANPDFYKDMADKVFDSTINQRKTKTNKKYKLAYEILKDKYKTEVISETSLWRLLKIKESDPETYKRIINCDISIKKAYSELCEKRKTVKDDEISVHEIPCTDMNINNIANSIEHLTGEIKEWATTLDDVDYFKLKEIDEKIFHLRKEIGKIIVKFDDDNI